jgi:F-type H+-transporting ATPase subunit a
MEAVFPKEVFTIFGIPVRNTVIATWVMIVLILAAVLYFRRRVPTILEMLIDFTDSLAGAYIKGPTDRYIPFLGSLLVFIGVANLIGIVPFMVTPTRDINTTLALALVVLVVVFAFAIQVKGIGGFAKGFLTVTVPLDLIGYVSRTLSLTLRLFGNVIGGEIIVFVLASLVPIGVPLVMVLLSSITGLLQAYVFTVLAASYISSELAK